MTFFFKLLISHFGLAPELHERNQSEGGLRFNELDDNAAGWSHLRFDFFLPVITQQVNASTPWSQPTAMNTLFTKYRSDRVDED